MNIGMLWFDNDPTTSLAKKIKLAMNHYEKKYGVTPNYCETNVEWTTDEVMPCEVVFDGTILPKHIWLGVKEQNHELPQEEKNQDKRKYE